MSEVTAIHEITDQSWWDHRLALEGMPPELPSNPVLDPRLARRVENIAEQLGRDPTTPELLDKLKPGKPKRAVLGEYGIRLAWNEAEEVAQADPRQPQDPTFDAVWSVARRGLLVEAFASDLSSRQRQVVTRIWGIGEDSPMSLNETGEDLGIASKRVFTIHKTAKGWLRNSRRIKSLRML